MADRCPEEGSRRQHALVDRVPEYDEPPVADTVAGQPAGDPDAGAGDGSNSRLDLDGVYAPTTTADSDSPLAVDGGEETPTPDEAADTTTGVSEPEPESDDETTAEQESTGPDATESAELEADVSTESEIDDSDAETKDDAVTEVAAETVAEDADETEPDESTDDGSPESAFVWPAADDDVDPAVSPTVRIGDDTDDPSVEEGPPALVTEPDKDASDTSRSPSTVFDEIDLADRDEIPVVRIVEPDRTDGGTPDPRTLTATLAENGTSVPDALESL